MHFPIGIDNYRELRQSNYIFVDKSELIKDFLDDGAKIRLVCRPRRFGKTLNMSMLSYFFSQQNAIANKALFTDTKVMNLTTAGGKKCMDYQGQYPIIFLTLKDFKGTTDYASFLKRLNNKLSSLYHNYTYLLTESSTLADNLKSKLTTILECTASEDVLCEALFLLTVALHEYHNTPAMVFLDEYDAPIQAAFMAKKPFDQEVIPFMADFLGSAFKSNEHLARGLLTGIAQISLINLFSGMNNVPISTFLSPKYASYFGFSRSEVAALVAQANLPTKILQDIEAWYNGYGIGDQQIYNPWSVINCLDNGGKLEAFWNESGEHGVIGRCLLNSNDPETLVQFKLLVEGEAIEADYKPGLIWQNITNRHALWNLLLTTGYLKVIADSGVTIPGKRIVTLKTPNNEVREVFIRFIYNWGQSPTTGNSIYDEAVNCLNTGDITSFCTALREYLQQTTSYYDFGKHTSKKFNHVFMLGLMFSLQNDFMIESNKEAGAGRPDIVVIPRNKEKYPTGIIFELKSIPSSNESAFGHALSAAHSAIMEQITSKHYPAALKQHQIKQALHVSMVFSGKDVQVNCESIKY